MERLGYRPALDGLRAVAILLVVLAHTFGVPYEGWLGVDLFFVLSGFLITTLLLEEREATGRVSLGGFYGRRARRLLPALVVMIALYAIGAAVAGHPLSLLGILVGGGYVTNIVRAFQLTQPPAGLGHLWSLALEEQFYLVWPFVLLVVLRGRRKLGLVAALGAVVFALVRDWQLGDGNAARLFFGPDTRLVTIAAGCALALVFAHQPWLIRAGSLLAPIAVVLLIGLSLTNVGFAPILKAWMPAVAIAGCLPILSAFDPRSPAARVLSFRPLVWLGRRSYSLYLVHVPILVAFGSLRATRSVTVSGAVALILSVIAAAASYRFVEQPIMRLGRSRRATALPGRDQSAAEQRSWAAVAQPNRT